MMNKRNMDEPMRRALLGDRVAQEELTKQEKLLPCPCCQKNQKRGGNNENQP